MKFLSKFLNTKTIFVFFLFGMLFVHADIMAQGFAVTGTVTESNSDPLPGVNVVVKGTLIGQVTNADGAFTINVPNADAVLVFSSVGFLSQEQMVGSNRTFNVVLQEDAQMLDEVVVVGYGVQRKVTVTGSVSTLRGEELQSSPTTNLSNGIVGRMAGVIGFQRADEPGGGGTTLRIRGTSTQGYKDPLYVIDGIPDREGGFNRLSASDIESVSILKDASAAIYGSRAANGVVLITTKRGTEGRAKITYSGNWGFTQPTRIPEMCNAFEYATLVNEIDEYYKSTPGRYSADDLQKYKDGSSPWTHPNTNYFDILIKPVSPTYRHDLSVSGGSERMRYYTSIYATGEDGLYYDSANRFDNYGVRTNLDIRINDYISLAFGNHGRMEVTNYPPFSAGDIFTSTVRSKPTDHGWLPNGDPGLDLEYGHQPAVMAKKSAGLEEQKFYHLNNDLKAVIKIPGVQGLSVITQFSYDKFFRMDKRWRTPFYLYAIEETQPGSGQYTTNPVLKGGGTRGLIDLRQETTDRTSWSNSTIVNYDFTVSSFHNFGIMAGMEAQQRTHQWIRAYRLDFLSDALDQIDNAPLDEREAAGNGWKEARLNYFGRITYNYQERYLFELVGRYDGSWRFPTENRFGFFPGASAAWRVSEEDFWNVRAINFFKIRASWAQTGMDYLVDADGNLDRSVQYLPTYRWGTEYLLGSTFYRTLQPSRVPNPNITWEQQTEYDLGIELRMLGNRLSFEGDIFLRKRSNMLRNRSASLPRQSGISAPRENIGEMSNRGVEALLRWDERKGNFSYFAAFNMTYSKDRLDFVDEVAGLPEWQKATGKMDGTQLFYEAIGVFQSMEEINSGKYALWSNAVRPGDLIFKKVDSENPDRITGADQVRINKRKEPLFVAGLSLGGAWNGFDISVLIQGAAGGHTYVYRERAGESGNFFKWMYDERWTGPGSTSKYPRIYNREEPYWAHEGDRRNTHFLRSTDYIRLKNIEVGYNFKTIALFRDLNIENLRIFAQGSNLITIDKIKFQDPEQNNASKDYFQRRYFNFGVTLTF